MHFIVVGVLLIIMTGCGDSENYHRGYVISRSHLDESIDEADSAMLTEQEP